MAWASFAERPPAVAGRFYPGDPAGLAREVERLLGLAAVKADPVSDGKPSPPYLASVNGAVVPHAGYVYSGGVAAAVFSRLRVPECVVLLGPNHTGKGPRISLRTGGAWKVPGASVPVHAEAALALSSQTDLVECDERAHKDEHALEVELPFLMARNPSVRIVPIVLGLCDVKTCRELGRVLSDCLPEDALVLASSDMNHYLSDELVRRRDRLAIDTILARDAEALHEVCVREDLSMCGFVPATVMLEYANRRGSQEARLCAYATSGEAFGDYERVVGYAGITV